MSYVSCVKATSLVAAGVVLAAAPLFAAPDRADGGERAGIVGDYLESRTSDVYTGPCFANSEVNLDGQEAVLAWRVRRGAWQGVGLDGLTVVAAVKADVTLGDPYEGKPSARSVIVVDDRATPEQRQSLVDFARAMGGELLEDVVGVRSAPIEAEFDADSQFAHVRAGDLVEARTRPLGHGDRICGNETVFYPPLTRVRHAAPAYTLANAYRGREFDSTWSAPLERSSFVAEFAR
jgi:hypothetical protein